jgi:hypothetical protein
MHLVRSELFSEFSRSNAQKSFEGSRKVALVEETSRRSNLADRSIRIGQFSTGEVNAHTPKVLSNRAAACFAKRLSQINRMQTGLLS